MTHLVVKDASTVTILGTVFTGPLELDTDAVTVGGVVYDGGVVLVNAGTAYQVAGIAPAHIVAMPYAFFAALVIGMAIAVYRK